MRHGGKTLDTDENLAETDEQCMFSGLRDRMTLKSKFFARLCCILEESNAVGMCVE